MVALEALLEGLVHLRVAVAALPYAMPGVGVGLAASPSLVAISRADATESGHRRRRCGRREDLLDVHPVESFGVPQVQRVGLRRRLDIDLRDGIEVSVPILVTKTALGPLTWYFSLAVTRVPLRRTTT